MFYVRGYYLKVLSNEIMKGAEIGIHRQAFYEFRPEKFINICWNAFLW